MARISGVELPGGKRAEIGLTYIYGIGRSLSGKILRDAGIDSAVLVKDLSEGEISRLTDVIRSDYRVEGELHREVSLNVKRLMDINAYCGLRHKRGLPVRGQRTKTNARTCKGPRRTVGAGKRAVTKK